MSKPPKKSQRKRSQRAMPTRSRQSLTFAITLIVLIVVFVLAFVLLPKPVKPMQLQQSQNIGHTVYAPGDTGVGGHGQTVDGIACDSGSKPLAYHHHVHLSIFVNGRQVAVPYGIGITPPKQVSSGFVDSGSCFYWVHTHDASGIIHIETPLYQQFTLSQFFDIWGRPLSRTDLLGHMGPVTVYLNGKAYSGNPRQIRLTQHLQITLETGANVAPPKYIFPPGL